MPRLLTECEEYLQQQVIDYLATAVPTHIEYTALEPPFDGTTATYPYIKYYDMPPYRVEEVYQWHTTEEFTTVVIVYEL